jgi:hypothetical protein
LWKSIEHDPADLVRVDLFVSEFDNDDDDDDDGIVVGWSCGSSLFGDVVDFQRSAFVDFQRSDFISCGSRGRKLLCEEEELYIFPEKSTMWLLLECIPHKLPLSISSGIKASW